LKIKKRGEGQVELNFESSIAGGRIRGGKIAVGAEWEEGLPRRGDPGTRKRSVAGGGSPVFFSKGKGEES